MAINLGPAHLRAIVALADAGTFTAAAASLGQAQSSLSRAVAEAESRVRLPLFERTTRRVSMTPDGEAVVAIARQVLGELDAGLAHIEGYLRGERGSLRIAALPSLAATLIPPFVLAMRRRQPEVAIWVDDSLSEGVLAALIAGEVDLAVTADLSAYGRPLTHVETIPVARDDFFLALPAEHRWAARSTVGWAELDGTDLVSFSAASSIHGVVDHTLTRHGVRPARQVAAVNVGSVAGLVAGGLGLAAVPGFVLPLLGFAGLTCVPLTPTVSRRIVLARDRRRPLTPVARAWVELMTGPQAPRPERHGVVWAIPD